MNWISVKDAFPSNNEIVIAVNDEEMAVCKFHKTEFEYFFMLYNTSYQVMDITHWAPLPERPKKLEVEKPEPCLIKDCRYQWPHYHISYKGGAIGTNPLDNHDRKNPLFLDIPIKQQENTDDSRKKQNE